MSWLHGVIDAIFWGIRSFFQESSHVKGFGEEDAHDIEVFP